MACSCKFWMFFTAVLAVVSGVLVGGIQIWLRDKSYVFSHEEVASITTNVLNSSSDADHNALFAMVEEALRERHPNHILPTSQKEWMFMNAGGWMGTFCLLHASLTEYVLFFGSAIATSGHSGRYWANISDTVIAGEIRQWKEGTTESIINKRGDTTFLGVWEAGGLELPAGTWMVEYGRGFIPSTLGFALADTIFGTQDFYILYRTVRIYIVALIQEIWHNGNI